MPDELRLAYLVLLTAIVVGSALRFVRRAVGGDWIETLLDALLLTFVIQYASVGLPGLLGILNVWSISVTAVLACGVLGAWAREGPAPTSVPARAPIEWPAITLGIFVLCYVICAIWEQRILPPVANDVLTYHLPAAVQWLQRGRIELYQTWFYDPSNTYSPLAGSVLAAWWLAPIGNDVLARFVQAPALLLLFVAMIQIVRALGVSTTAAALIATGAVTSRPFISQTILAKDDLYVAAFFATAVAGLTRVKLNDPLGPWRVGGAMGMLLATKYTALPGALLLLLAIDTPLRAGWKLRHWLVAAACVLALAGPWYVRNALLTDNPLFPLDLGIWDGLMTTRRSPELESLAGLSKVLITGYYSTTIPVAVVLGIAWLAAVVAQSRHVLRTPLVRLCLLGPPIGIALFLLLSPYPEIRFIYPSLLLMFACGGMVAFWLRSHTAGVVVGAVIMLGGVMTGFIPQLLQILLPAAVVSSALLALIAWRVSKLHLRHMRRAVAISALVLVALAGCVVYVSYTPFLRRSETGYADTCVEGWKHAGYGALADAWQFVRTQLPPDATLAYSNTHYTYPLQGFDLTRRVIYAPTRRNLRHLHDLPRFDSPVTGAQIVSAASDALSIDPDLQTWMRNLSSSGAEYLIVVKGSFGPAKKPPEFELIAQSSATFGSIFENEAAMVYEIHHE